MKKIMFAGHSDDIVYVRHDGEGTTEYNVNSGLSPAAAFLIAHEGEALLVYAHYDSQGCWYFGVGRLEEGKPLPAWRVSIGTLDELWNGYTAVLIIEVPLAATLHRWEVTESTQAAEEPADITTPIHHFHY